MTTNQRLALYALWFIVFILGAAAGICLDAAVMKPVPAARPVVAKPEPSRSGVPRLKYRYLGEFVATAYCLTGPTASGVPAGPGLIGVDPAVIPLGTMLYVEGYGLCKAADTGGAIKGKKLDLWMSDETTCDNYGRQKVEVWEVER